MEKKKRRKKVLKRIWVARGKGKEIAKDLGCSNVTVSNALAGRTRTELGEKIRFVALTQYDGEEIKQKRNNKKQ